MAEICEAWAPKGLICPRLGFSRRDWESGPEEAKAPTVGTIPARPGGKAGSALAHVSCPTLSGGGVLARLADPRKPPNPDYKLDNKPGKDVA